MIGAWGAQSRAGQGISRLDSSSSVRDSPQILPMANFSTVTYDSFSGGNNPHV
jgi:hypothetical protein